MPRMYFTGERRPKNLAKELPGEPAGGYHCNTKVRTHGLLRATLDRVLPVGPVLSVLLNTLQSRPHLTTYNTPPRSLCKAATAAGTCVRTNSGLHHPRVWGARTCLCAHLHHITLRFGTARSRGRPSTGAEPLTTLLSGQVRGRSCVRSAAVQQGHLKIS